MAKSLTTPRPPQATIFDVANHALADAGVQTITTKALVPPVNLGKVAHDTGFDETLAAVRASERTLAHSETGFTIVGASLVSATAHPAIRTELISLGSSNETGVRIELNGERACSVALRCADGSGTVLAAVRGFIGTVVVDRGNIVNVSYAPSPNNPLSLEFQQERERLMKTRAAVAAAVSYGVFQIDGDRETRARKAEELSDRIRVVNAVDPTLSLYAAYAYASANLIDKVRLVNDLIRRDLNVELFDLALLSGGLSDRQADASITPCCPMLTQGWGLLRANGARIADEVAVAQDHVRTSSWTVLAPAGMDIVTRPIQEGRLR